MNFFSIPNSYGWVCRLMVIIPSLYSNPRVWTFAHEHFRFACIHITNQSNKRSIKNLQNILFSTFYWQFYILINQQINKTHVTEGFHDLWHERGNKGQKKIRDKLGNGVLIKWPPGVTVGASRQLGRRWRKQEQRGGACEYWHSRGSHY